MKLIKDLGMKYPLKTSKQKKRYGIYECPICNIRFETQTQRVKNGKATKCKSCASKVSKNKHGQYGTKLYRVWGNMIQRIENSNHHKFKDYGDRGISICDEWKDFGVFYEWSIYSGYKEGLSIDRIDNDGNYEPSNCRWTNKCTQQQNTRRIRVSNKSGFRGVCYINSREKWKASITSNNKTIFLGYFDSAKDSAKAYNRYIVQNNLENTLNIIKEY
jgi:hypothetical protein